ncbi:MAG: hypothetical protein HYS43_00595 [Candidatus Liptonbacteria bacterium]|nr:hypothetical protein [Candidatus Liptonbacteria bacterium]
MIRHIYSAAKQVLKERKYAPLFLLLALFFFGLFVLIPIITTPGNTLAFQLSIFRVRDYALMVSLALLVGLNFSMNIYARREQKRSAAVSGSAAGIGGIFGAIVGTASCTSCLAYLFGIMGLGFGSVAFVLEYQTFFLLGAIALVVLALYFAARKINKACDSC